MATISGGGSEVTITPPPATGDGNLQAFNHTISDIQNAIDGGARVVTYDPLNPSSIGRGGQSSDDDKGGRSSRANDGEHGRGGPPSWANNDKNDDDQGKGGPHGGNDGHSDGNGGQPFVMLVDKETLDASGPLPIMVPSEVDYLAVEDGVNAPITVQGDDHSSVTIVGGTGDNTYFVNGPTSLIDTGGTNFVQQTGDSSQGSEFRLGAGNDTVLAGGGDDTVVAGTGNDFTSLGAGNDTAFVQGNDTVFTGAGNDTVSVDFGNVLVNNESGNLTFINGQDASTVLGGSGSTTIFGGVGGGLYIGGTEGDNVMTAGEGATTLIGGGAGDILFAAGSTGDMLVAGSGNTTLNGGASTGDNTFKAGSGNDLIVGGVGSDTIFAGGGDDTAFGGAGNDIFKFLNSLTDGGNLSIADFTPGADKIDLSGYTGSIDQLLNNQENTAQGTMISLSDGTEITFTGVEELKKSDFT